MVPAIVSLRSRRLKQEWFTGSKVLLLQEEAETLYAGGGVSRFVMGFPHECRPSVVDLVVYWVSKRSGWPLHFFFLLLEFLIGTFLPFLNAGKVMVEWDLPRRFFCTRLGRGFARDLCELVEGSSTSIEVSTSVRSSSLEHTLNKHTRERVVVRLSCFASFLASFCCSSVSRRRRSSIRGP